MTQSTYSVQRATIAEFDNYPAAQAAVDLLADKDFEVGTVRIVGHDLTSVEQVLGKRTYGRAAGYGALSGAWLGLMLGVLFALFVPAIAWLNVILWSVLIAAAFGAVFGLLGHALSSKERSFAAASTIKAASYSVEVVADRADEALRLLAAGR